MNVTELLERTRDILRERVGTSNASLNWQDDELLRCLNAANDLMWKKARQADENWGLATALLSELSAVATQVGERYYNVRFPRHLGTVKYMEEIRSDSGITTEIPMLNIRQTRYFHNTPLLTDLSPRGWWPGANESEIFVTNQPRGLDLTAIRVWFLRRTPRLLRFTSSVYAATNQLTTDRGQATLGTLEGEDGLYDGAVIEHISGGAQLVVTIGNHFYVTDFSVSGSLSLVFTLNPEHGIGSGTSTWEVIPTWPEEHHELLALVAARRALLSGSSVDDRISIEREMAQEWEAFINNIEDRHYQAAHMVSWEDPEP